MYQLIEMAIITLAGSASLASSSELPNMIGNWRTVRHGAEVLIIDCGNGSPCGRLVSVGSDIRGRHTSDVRNRNPALRNRSLKSLPIFWGYSHGKKGWTNGRLYNPETGQTFRSSLKLINRNRLRVTGCLGLFCRSQTWTRIKPNRNSTNRKQNR